MAEEQPKKKFIAFRLSTLVWMCVVAMPLIVILVSFAALISRAMRPEAQKPLVSAPVATPQPVDRGPTKEQLAQQIAAERAARRAAEEAPLPTKARVDFYTLVVRGDTMISIGSVSKKEREKEQLDEECATIPGRWTENLGEYDRFVHLRYTAGTPRERKECPTGTAYFMESRFYRGMDRRYAELLDGQEAEQRARERFQNAGQPQQGTR